MQADKNNKKQPTKSHFNMIQPSNNQRMFNAKQSQKNVLSKGYNANTKRLTYQRVQEAASAYGITKRRWESKYEKHIPDVLLRQNQTQAQRNKPIFKDQLSQNSGLFDSIQFKNYKDQLIRQSQKQQPIDSNYESHFTRTKQIKINSITQVQTHMKNHQTLDKKQKNQKRTSLQARNQNRKGPQIILSQKIDHHIKQNKNQIKILDLEQNKPTVELKKSKFIKETQKQKQIQKQKQKDKRKNNRIQLQQNQLNQQKIKDIYDKLRNQNQNQSSSRQSSPSKIVSRNRIENQNQYLEKITNKKSQTEKKIKKLSYAQQILSGKMSIIWIFCLKSELVQIEIKNQIYEMYNGLTDDRKVVPFVDNPKKVRDYLNIPNCYFKIVTDIQNAQAVLGYKIYKNVIEFYIFHDNNRNDSIQKALQLKKITKKTKGIFNQWQKLLNRAEQQIQEQISIYKVNSGLQKRQRQKKFPNFLKLTDTDKTDATLYRINLYGSIKLINKQRQQNLQYFMKLVNGKYGQNQCQSQNIIDYKQLNHISAIKEQLQAKQVIKFYVRESFYYQILNSMLRTMKTVYQFKPCILPFNQTYHSIKIYYEKYLSQYKNIIPQMILYRGCKMSKKNFRSLKIGVYIQMFGFMSTSKSLKRAQNFVDRDGYIFVIHIKKRSIKQKFKNFDHGFVDINKYNLAPDDFKEQQQILFNALNVYKVIKVQQKDSYTFIHLQYGVIFDLLQKSKQSLTTDQYDTLVNYHYCTKILGKIQDQGDVFLFANQLIEAKQYYDKKIKQGENLANNYFKLANVQKQCGQIDQAQKNANQALKLYGDKIDKDDKQKCMKIFSIHTKNAQINIEKQDYLTADQDIDKAISLLTDEQMLQKSIKLRQRGQIKFKKGQIKTAEQDFSKSQLILQNIKNQASKKKLQAYKNYFLSHFTLFCSQKNLKDLKSQLNQTLYKVQQLQQKIISMNQNIQDQLIKINKSLKDVSLYVENRQNYEYYVKKAQSYLFSMQARKTNDPQIKAKLLATQAMIDDYKQLAQSQKLMNQAIKLIQQKNPYDMKVAQYSKILAKMQKFQLQKFQNPSKKLINIKPNVKVPYNSIQRKQIYQRCQQNFKKTINVLIYQSKDKSSPEILDLRNQLGQLSYNENDYEQCEKSIQQIRNGNQKLIHSQMAKALLLKAKISYSRGQLKNAFQVLSESQKILQDSMVNKHLTSKDKYMSNNKLIKSDINELRKKYYTIYEKSDTYLSIKYLRVTIYHKQKEHELALKNILSIQKIITDKVGINDSHPMYAQVLQLRGGIEVFRGNIYEFDEYFEKAIKLRQKQFGLYHPINAKAHCSYAKYLIMVKDIQKAQKNLQKAVQIISAFDQNNPNYWAVYYAEGFLNQDKKQYQKADDWYQKSLKWAKGHFNKSHISIKQIMLRYANTLTKSQRIQQSINLYQQLQQQLQSDIRQSNKKITIQNQKDDQKITLTKLMYSQLTESQVQINTYTQMNQSLHGELNTSVYIDRSLYKTKLNMLRRTYSIAMDDNQI